MKDRINHAHERLKIKTVKLNLYKVTEYGWIDICNIHIISVDIVRYIFGIRYSELEKNVEKEKIDEIGIGIASNK